MISRWSDTALRRATLVLLAVFTALIVVAVVQAPELLGRSARQHPEAAGIDMGFVISGSALAVVGVLLTWLRTRNPIGWLLVCAGLCGALGNAGQVYGALAIAAPEKHLPGGYLVLAASAPLWIPSLVMPATVVLARFPSGHVSGRWACRLDRLAIAGMVVLYLGYANAPNAITDEIRDQSPPHLVPAVAAGVAMGSAPSC